MTTYSTFIKKKRYVTLIIIDEIGQISNKIGKNKAATRSICYAHYTQATTTQNSKKRKVKRMQQNSESRCTHIPSVINVWKLLAPSLKWTS